MDADFHIQTMKSLLDRLPNLMANLSWRVIDRYCFSNPDILALYVPTSLDHLGDRR